MATAVDLKPNATGGSEIDYDDGSKIAAPLDPAMQALVRHAMWAPKPVQPMGGATTPPGLAAAFDRINRSIGGN